MMAFVRSVSVRSVVGGHTPLRNEIVGMFSAVPSESCLQFEYGLLSWESAFNSMLTRNGERGS